MLPVSSRCNSRLYLFCLRCPEILGHDVRVSWLDVARPRSADSAAGKRVSEIGAVDSRDVGERARDVECQVQEGMIVRAREAAAQDELVAAGEQSDRSVCRCLRIPVETEPRLEVVGVALGHRREGNRRSPVAWTMLSLRSNRLDGIAGKLVAEAQRKRQVVLTSPFVLHEEEQIVPLVVVDRLTTWQWLVDIRGLGVSSM